MNDNIFLNSFQFEELHFRNAHHNDKSRGLQYHYLVFVKQGTGILQYKKQKIDVRCNDMFYVPMGCKYCSDWHGENIIFDTFAFKYFPSNAFGNFELQKIQYTDEIFEVFRPLMENKALDCNTIGRLYTVLGMLEPILKLSTPISNEEYTVNKAIKISTRCRLLIQNFIVEMLIGFMRTTVSVICLVISRNCHYCNSSYILRIAIKHLIPLVFIFRINYLFCKAATMRYNSRTRHHTNKIRDTQNQKKNSFAHSFHYNSLYKHLTIYLCR